MFHRTHAPTRQLGLSSNFRNVERPSGFTTVCGGNVASLSARRYRLLAREQRNCAKTFEIAAA
jgi:hypothetical protein